MKPVFDREQAMKTTGDDMELLRELIEVFLDQRDELLEQIETAIERKDPATLQRAAHSMKGALLNLGGRAAGEVALQLEVKGAEGSTEDVDNILQQLKTAIAEFEQAVSDI